MDEKTGTVCEGKDGTGLCDTHEGVLCGQGMYGHLCHDYPLLLEGSEV